VVVVVRRVEVKRGMGDHAERGEGGLSWGEPGASGVRKGGGKSGHPAKEGGGEGISLSARARGPVIAPSVRGCRAAMAWPRRERQQVFLF
jgi:hypothetical protein